jgi:hypothetical protein
VDGGEVRRVAGAPENPSQLMIGADPSMMVTNVRGRQLR